MKYIRLKIKLVKSLGLEMNNKKIKELIKNRSKWIRNNRYGEFTAMMLSYQFNKESPVEAHLENAFNLYDKDQDGIISQDDLIKVSNELEDILGMEEASLLISLAKNFGKEYGLKYEKNRTNREKFSRKANFIIKFRY